jgi:hypothetical protein
MKKATAYKIEILVIDFENMPVSEIEFLIENVKYLYPKVMSIQSEKILDWTDEHPLNHIDTSEKTYREMFYGKL